MPHHHRVHQNHRAAVLDERERCHMSDKTCLPVILFNGQSRTFHGEYPSWSDVPEAIVDDPYTFELKRDGNDIICDVHPMMSPLPDMRILNGASLPHEEIMDRSLAWWNENYGI